MNSPLTLHDFVLNLLSDADARADFQADPDGALSKAGLSDVNAADVHEVIPLVVDYAPASVAGLHSALPELAPAVLSTERAGAIHQLQFVTSQLTTASNADLSLAAAGSLSGAARGYAGVTAGADGIGGTLHLSGDGDVHGGSHDGSDDSGSGDHSGGFSHSGDLSSTLDAGLTNGTASLTGSLDATTSTLVGIDDDPVHHAVGGLTHDLSHTTHGIAEIASDTAHGLTSALSPGDALDPGNLLGGHGIPDTGSLLGGHGDVLGHGDPLGHGGLASGLGGALPAGLPGVDSATGLLHGANPLHLSGSGDASGSGDVSADSHPLDSLHLF